MLAIYGILDCWRVCSRDGLKKITYVSHLTYVEKLKVLEFFSIFSRLVRTYLIKYWKIFHSEVDIGLLDGFTVAVDQRTHSHSFKIVVPRCVLEMRRHFFHVWIIQQWNSLSEHTVMQPALSSFKRVG